MNWTKETPTTQGYYWLRTEWARGYTYPAVVQVVAGGVAESEIYVFGTERVLHRTDFAGDMEWYGPIEPPE